MSFDERLMRQVSHCLVPIQLTPREHLSQLLQAQLKVLVTLHCHQ
jgi:hypothetical protein